MIPITALIVGSSLIAVAADAVPTLKVEPSCRAAGIDGMITGRTSESCMNDEKSAREDLAILHAQQAQIDPQQYLLSVGWRRAISFQPSDRFWTFQAIEAGIFVALAALTVLATLWLVRRTPS